MLIQVTGTWSAAGGRETEGVLIQVPNGVGIKKSENHLKSRPLVESMKSLYYLMKLILEVLMACKWSAIWAGSKKHFEIVFSEQCGCLCAFRHLLAVNASLAKWGNN